MGTPGQYLDIYNNGQRAYSSEKVSTSILANHCYASRSTAKIVLARRSMAAGKSRSDTAEKC
jgi:hypothetical protein